MALQKGGKGGNRTRESKDGPAAGKKAFRGGVKVYRIRDQKSAQLCRAGKGAFAEPAVFADRKA